MPDGVPTLSFVKEGELTYTVDANKHDSYTGLKKILNKHFISSNIEIVSTKTGFDSYCLKHSDYVAYSYDLSSNKSIELAAKDIIIESVASSKKNILLLNKDVFADSFDEIIAHYGVSTESFSIQVKNKEVKKTIDYQTDGDQLKDLISSL